MMTTTECTAVFSSKYICAIFEELDVFEVIWQPLSSDIGCASTHFDKVVYYDRWPSGCLEISV